jgi:hypothetical protein
MVEKINQEREGMICDIEMQEPISIEGKIRFLFYKYRTNRMEVGGHKGMK